MCSSLHPLKRQSLFSQHEKNGGTLNRITAAIHTCVSPLDPKAFTDRSMVVSLRAIEHIGTIFAKLLLELLALEELPRLLVTTSVGNLCFYCHSQSNSTIVLVLLLSLLL